MNLSKKTIPPLRREVEIVEESGRERLSYAIVDRGIGQKIRIDEPTAMLASALSQEWTFEALQAALAAAGLRIAPDLLMRFISFLDAHHLFEGDRARRRIAALDALDASPQDATRLQFWPETRHACVACGGSCEGHDIGPIAQAQVQAIRAGMQRDGFVERQTKHADTSGHYCAMVDDRCVFLRPDHLCDVHAQLGLSPKPTDCRIFPLAFTQSPTGVRVGLRLECREYLASKRNASKHKDGSLEERCDELRALVEASDSMAEAPDWVPLDGQVTVPYREWAALRDRLLETVADHPAEPLRGLRRALEMAMDAVTQVRVRERGGWVFPPAMDDESTGMNLGDLTGRLAAAATSTAQLNAAAGKLRRAVRLHQAARGLSALPLWARAWDTPSPPLGADEAELLTDHLVQSLFLDDPACGPHVSFGLGLLRLQIQLALAARADGAALNAALADTLKALRQAPMLQALHALADPVAEHFVRR